MFGFDLLPRIALTTCAVGLSGCLWIPGFPPDREQPTPEESEDNRNVSHCSPHHAPTRPVLLGVQFAPVNFRCRIRDPSTALWRIEFGDTAVGGYDLGSGVPSLTLDRADLPWHPLAYDAELQLEVRGQGESDIRRWSITVLPDPDALRLPVPE